MIVIINASPRKNGINDQISQHLVEELNKKNVENTLINLRDYKIEHCSHCRSCMKEKISEKGICSIDDDMKIISEKLFAAQTIIITAPLSCYDFPSKFRTMHERLVGLAYWGDEMYAPQIKNCFPKKMGILITTSGMPGIFVPFFTNIVTTFKNFAKLFPIKKKITYHIGLKGRKQDMTYTDKNRKIVAKVLKKIIN